KFAGCRRPSTVNKRQIAGNGTRYNPDMPVQSVTRILLVLLGVLVATPWSWGQTANALPSTLNGRKIGLFIGNNAYALGNLHNPVNDATALQAQFNHLGFEPSQPLLNATLEQMDAAIDK